MRWLSVCLLPACATITARPEVAHVLAGLVATSRAARVEALAAAVGWSRRHLGARYREDLGLAPDALARLIRVEHAAERMRAGDPLAGVAYGSGSGYADQPRFNRDFHELVGFGLEPHARSGLALRVLAGSRRPLRARASGRGGNITMDPTDQDYGSRG